MEDTLWVSSPVQLVLDTSAHLPEQRKGLWSPSILIPSPWASGHIRHPGLQPDTQHSAALSLLIPHTSSWKRDQCDRPHCASFGPEGSQRSFPNSLCTSVLCGLECRIPWRSHTPTCWLLPRKEKQGQEIGLTPKLIAFSLDITQGNLETPCPQQQWLQHQQGKLACQFKHLPVLPTQSLL